MPNISIVIFYLSIFKLSQSANILAVFPFTAHSHFTMFKSLVEELHSRGHNLTVLSHFPRKSSIVNYTDISLIGATKSLHANMSLSNLTKFGLLDNLNLLNEQINDYEPLLCLPAVKKLINSKQTFDLILTEIFNTDLFLGFYHIFNCPNIALSASPLMPWSYSRIGLTIQPSVTPIVFSDRAGPMSVWSMAANSLEWAITLFYYKYYMNPKSEEIARKHFGNIPPLEDLSEKTNLILVNTHFSLHKQMPTSNRLIEVGGMHIKETEPLNSDLERYLNESENGVIVFSMGSMFRAESIPKEIFNIFLNVFSTLKQNILWKWEDSKPPVVKNIKFMKWIPQRDVLAHKNVKVFIYHGGLLGVSEAVYCGVPILGFPQFGDMLQNMAALGEAGISLALQTLTEANLRESIDKLINDPKYKRKMEDLSLRYRDRPESPLSRAVYWVEYTLRHNAILPTPPQDLQQLIVFMAALAVALFLPTVAVLTLLAFIRSTHTKKKKLKEV